MKVELSEEELKLIDCSLLAFRKEKVELLSLLYQVKVKDKDKIFGSIGEDVIKADELQEKIVKFLKKNDC